MNDEISDNSNANGTEPKRRGRPPGSKNKATLLAGRLAEEQGNELLNKTVEVALQGNVPMLKFLLERILPKERTVEFDLHPLERAHDSVDAMSEIAQAVAYGRITPREAADLSQVVSTYLRSIETTEAEEVLDDLRDKLDDQRAIYQTTQRDPRKQKNS